jgi:chaperone required for assembly of F1-ATPase
MTNTKSLLADMRRRGVEFGIERDGGMVWSADGRIVKDVSREIEANYSALAEQVKREWSPLEAPHTPVAPNPGPQMSLRQLAADGLSPTTIIALQRDNFVKGEGDKEPSGSPKGSPEASDFVPLYVYCS